MRNSFFSTPALACTLVGIVWAMLTLGPYMRETDEGSLLDGGLNIANGHLEIARTEFNFDKQFVSYWLPGLLFKCLPHPRSRRTRSSWPEMLWGLVLFWGAMFWLIARSSRHLPLALVLPVILTPALLLYSPFYASAFTSVAFMLLLAILLDRKKWELAGRCRRFCAGILRKLGCSRRRHFPYAAPGHAAQPASDALKRAEITGHLADAGRRTDGIFFGPRALS